MEWDIGSMDLSNANTQSTTSFNATVSDLT